MEFEGINSFFKSQSSLVEEVLIKSSMFKSNPNVVKTEIE